MKRALVDKEFNTAKVDKIDGAKNDTAKNDGGIIQN